MAPPNLPQRARVVVVGGGVIGCSVAYHLAHMGWNDVVLLERDRLTSGTTWHAAGLMVTFGSTSETSTEMRKYTRDLYARLEAETGQATGLQAGRLHRGRDRRATGSRSTGASRRSTATAASTCTRSRRARSQDAVPARAHRRHPRRLLRQGGRAREPGRRHDGAREGRAACRARRSSRASPSPASSHAARRGHRRRAPRTATSRPSTSSTAPACGRASSARASGVNIPLQAAEHYYLITEQIPGLSTDVAGARGSRRRTATSARRSAA